MRTLWPVTDRQRKSPLHETPLTADDVGAMAAFLVSDGARYIIGNVTFPCRRGRS
ncbi:MAG: hypothetical protein WB580_09100 [Candidatus Binataceae bacterium]|jgi:enoyl-[acyl-carrier-protein] reductase (NADH)